MNSDQSIYNLLSNKFIGISISESEDLEMLGMSQSHLQDAKIEIARHLLAVGSVLTYGGDLRDDGFTRILIDLVESYKPSEIKEDRLSLINYLAWPIHSQLDESFRAQVSERIEFKILGLPDHLPQNLSAKKYLSPSEPKHFYIWASSLTNMRKAMTARNNARIAIGGKTKNFKGKYPGIVEEVYVSLLARKPVFLIGAFGGATKDIIDAINGKSPDRLEDEYQINSEQERDFVKFYNGQVKRKTDQINYATLVDYFNKIGISGLNNGLTSEENKRLFKSIHLPEIVSLILKGLVISFSK